jgi:hypothetical protein
MFRSPELARRFFSGLGWEMVPGDPWAYRASDGRVCRLRLDGQGSHVHASYVSPEEAFDAAVERARASALPASSPSVIIDGRRTSWLQRLLSGARVRAPR